jgi:hypothetical protein
VNRLAKAVAVMAAGVPRFGTNVVAITAAIAAIGVLVVLITPAPDELPSTGPHALNTAFSLASNPIYPPSNEVCSGARLESGLTTPLGGVDLLSLTCTRLC